MGSTEKIVLKTESRKEFFQYIRSYIEEFTYLNPLRALDIPIQPGSPPIQEASSTMVTPKIELMAQRIRNSTTYPPVGHDQKTGEPEIGTDPKGGFDIVVAAILEEPPTVSILRPEANNDMRRMQFKPPLGKDKSMKIIPSTKEDIDLAKTETLYFKKSFPSSQNFNTLIEKCKNF